MIEKKFKLEFIKFYPDIQYEYKLTDLDTKIYWYVKAVIEFQKGIWNEWVCYTLSKTMADNLHCKEQSINNSVMKLKNIWLIEVYNTTSKLWNRKSRKMYLKWEAPQNKDDKVSSFFGKYNIIYDNKINRKIIWDWIYNYKVKPETIIYILKDYTNNNNELIDTEILREFYQLIISYTNNGYVWDEEKIQNWEKVLCKKCYKANIPNTICECEDIF